MKRTHSEQMDDCRKRYERGDKLALMSALFVCIFAKPQKQIPDWAQLAFAEAFLKVFYAEVESWDDVFGKKFPKGHIKQHRKKIELLYPVWSECQRRRRKGEAIDEVLFTRVGKRFHIGAGQVREIYYRMKKAGWAEATRQGSKRLYRKRA